MSHRSDTDKAISEPSVGRCSCATGVEKSLRPHFDLHVNNGAGLGNPWVLGIHMERKDSLGRIALGRHLTPRIQTRGLHLSSPKLDSRVAQIGPQVRVSCFTGILVIASVNSRSLKRSPSGFFQTASARKQINNTRGYRCRVDPDQWQRIF